MKIKPFLQNKYFKLLIKIGISGICLFILSRKINFSSINSTIQNLHFLYLLTAGVFFIFSKLLSALRLQKYFQSVNITLHYSENVKLYWLGMFYNLFLPGGIGGDGYKAYYLRRQFKEISIKKIITALLKDRLNGFIILCILMVVIARFLDVSIPYTTVFSIGGIIFFILALYLIEKLILPDTVPQIGTTSFYSLLVQLTQLASVVFILLSVGIHDHSAEIVFVFLLSTIIVMIPVSIGGIGLRELTFIYFADYFQYNKDNSVSVAFLFFAITSLIALPGIYYHFRPDKLNRRINNN